MARRALLLAVLAYAACLVALLLLPTTGLADPPGGAGGWIADLHWNTTSPAPGVQVLSASFADPTVHPAWTVTLQAPTQSPFDGSPETAEVGSSAWAQTTVAALQADGIAARTDVVDWPDWLGDPVGVMGVRVRVGAYPTSVAAAAEAATLTADGFSTAVEWEGDDPGQPPDAELLHAVIVDPRTFTGRVQAVHGTAIASRQTVAAQAQAQAQAQALGSLAAVNGGFFTISGALPGVGGVPTGLGVYDGRLEALANGARADLVLSGRRAAVANLRSVATARAGGAATRILGINRQPGSAEDCGVPGFSPTSAPLQGPVCTGPDDLVLFTDRFGAPLPTGAGTQVTLDASGRVIAIGAPGGTVPGGDEVLQGIGADAAWLTAHAHVGRRVHVSERLMTTGGLPVALTPQTSIISAAPRLLTDGAVTIDATAEGVFDPRDLDDYTFGAERHARTIAGVTADGRIVLVTADGIPGVSEGLTLDEEAALMRSLGAMNALNLDGGGSTSFVLDGQTVNDPSDATGARAVGDSIQVIP